MNSHSTFENESAFALERAEDALRENEERLKLAFAGAQEGVWDWNLETGAVEEKTIAAEDDPLIQAQAKPVVDQKRVFEIFTFADGVTRYLLSTMQRLA